MSFRNLDPEILSVRYGYAPQMREYDALEPCAHPYLAFSAPRGAQGTVVSTDADGFRRTPWRGSWTDSRTDPAGLTGAVLGGSFAFGVGATCDDQTIAAHLARESGGRWLNLGIRAGNSSQELAAALPIADRVPCFLVCSGVNNLVAALQTAQPVGYFDPLFFEDECAAVGTIAVHDIVEWLAGRSRARNVLAGLRRPERATPGANPTASVHGNASVSLAERRRMAFARQMRDLTALVRLAGRERVVFCAQPLADETTRSQPEELSLFRAHDRRQGTRWHRVREFALASWPEYMGMLAAGCAKLGVSFIELAAASFYGWSFVDRVHMTDNGYQQAAALIMDANCF